MKLTRDAEYDLSGEIDDSNGSTVIGIKTAAHF